MCHVSITRKRIDLYPSYYIDKTLPVDWTWVDYQFQGVPWFRKKVTVSKPLIFSVVSLGLQKVQESLMLCAAKFSREPTGKIAAAHFLSWFNQNLD